MLHGQRLRLVAGQAFAADAAQGVELALADVVVAALALDHGLHLGLVELGRTDVRLARRHAHELARGRGDLAGHAPEQAAAFVFWLRHGCRQ